MAGDNKNQLEILDKIYIKNQAYLDPQIVKKNSSSVENQGD